MAKQMIFQLVCPVRQASELEPLANKMEVLKKHGEVEIQVGFLAERTSSDIPPGGSSWHDYTSCLSTWQKFFPHPKMQPFLDMEHVAKNRALLREVMAVVHKHGCKAGVQFHTPFFLPEEFFEEYPHLRGGRCDHPRRSRREAFALCVDHPEVLEMYREMSAEMAREIPELEWMKVMCNDAGAGLCWSDWLYIGPNGPAACQHISTARRVKTLLDAVVAGIGRPIDFVMNGNFSEAELREMAHTLGDSFHYELHHGAKNDDRQADVGPRSDNPVKGIIDAVGILESLARTKEPKTTRVGIASRMNYNRGHDLDDAVTRVIEMVDAFFKEPAYTTPDRFILLRKICEMWVGPERRDDLLEAFVSLHEALKAKDLMTFRYLANYMGVSMRHINRPLVIMPELLTPDEESYFLPHVFNIHTDHARTDYCDLHGSRMVGGHQQWSDQLNFNPRLKILDEFHKQLYAVASVLDNMGGTPAGETLTRMAISLRLYACVCRSVNNCMSLGQVRNRNLAKLSGPPTIPPKLGDWIGDPDLQLMFGTMRDELDNTTEMIRLLENGGMRQMLVAQRPEDEDTFLLGPDLLNQLHRKMKIMRRHWIDAQAYLATPHK